MDKDDPNINKIIFSDYIIKKRIGKGSFGTVYQGLVISSNQKVALKLEKRNGDFPGILETEACRLYLLQGEGIPKIICYGTTRTDNVLIQELLGNSLEEIFNDLGKQFSLKTVCNIGIQMIKRIRHIHKNYHLHRDIKPDNFMTGYNSSDNKIYIIDFGLSKKYYSTTKKQHIKFKSGKSLVGTARYCSRNAHKGFELSRRDDVESIGYCLIYFLKGTLPWQGLRVKKIEEQFRKIAEKKIKTSFEELTKDIPNEFLEYFRHCDKLNFEDEPHYDYLIALFKNALSKYCANDNEYEYDWKKQIEESKNNTNLLKMIYNNSKNVSLLVNNNNLSAIDSKGEEKDNKGDNNISKVILSKDILKEENNSDKNKEEKNKPSKFLAPKKVDDFFDEGDFKSEEMSIKGHNEKETNHVNVSINNISSSKNYNNISNNIINNIKKEDNEFIKEKGKNNKRIINNFKINININKDDIKNNTINDNININKKGDVVYEYEFGLIDSKNRNRIKKIEGNIINKETIEKEKKDKENNIMCGCNIL